MNKLSFNNTVLKLAGLVLIFTLFIARVCYIMKKPPDLCTDKENSTEDFDYAKMNLLPIGAENIDYDEDYN